MYFDSSLKGLSVGSPVSFRGVQIGQVKNIIMEIDRDRRRVLTPVYVEIDHEKFRMPGFTGQISLLSEPPIKRMIEHGLRAQLQSQSFITGQMYIELEFRPSYPPRLRDENRSGMDEIPTIPRNSTKCRQPWKRCWRACASWSCTSLPIARWRR